MSDPRIYAETWNYGAGEEPLDNLEGRNAGPYPGYHRAGPHYDYPDRLRPPEWPFGHASAPSWQPGYVPSATEWRSWFSRKYDTDDATLQGGPFIPLGGGQVLGPLLLAQSPRTPMEACTKAYADSLTPASGPFLSANGGTVTGDVTMAGGLQVGGGLYADCDLYVRRDLKVSQTLYVQGYSMFANNVDVNANLTATNTLYIGPIGAQGYRGACPPGDDEAALRQAMWGFYVDPNTGDRITSYTNGVYDQWRQSDGLRLWCADGGNVLMDLNTNGMLSVNDLLANSNVSCQNVLVSNLIQMSGSNSANITGVNYIEVKTLNDTGLLNVGGSLDVAGPVALHGGLGVNGGAGITGAVEVTGTFTADSNAVVGGALTVNGGGAPQALYVAGSIHCTLSPGQGDSIFAEGDIQATGRVIAGGVALTSDARLKRDIAPARVGLEQVLQLQPKTFTRGTGGRELGLIAQDVQEVLPEAVYGTDTLGITVMPVLTALIGAVQELDRKLEMLAAR